MKFLLAVLFSAFPTFAFAHDSTAPHAHPHASSILPDYALLLLAAALVACGVIAVRVWRKE